MKFKRSIMNMMLLALWATGCIPVPRDREREIHTSSLPVNIVWQNTLDEPVVKRPLLSDKRIVLQTINYFIALDSVDGRIIWQHSLQPEELALTPYIVEEAQVQDNSLLYGDNYGYITALDLDSGKELWSFKVGGNYGDFVSDITISDGIIFSVAQPTFVEARRISTGQVLWEFAGLNYGLRTRGPRLFFYNHMLMISSDKTIFVDPQTGNVIDQFDISLYGYQQIDDHIYSPTEVREIDSLSTPRSIQPTSIKLLYDNCNQFRLPFTSFENSIYGVGYCGGIFRLSTEGDMVWEYEKTFNAEPATAVYGGNLYIMFDNGEIHAVDPSSGKVKGLLKMNLGISGFVENADFTSRGLTANDSVIVATFNDREIWAFR